MENIIPGENAYEPLTYEGWIKLLKSILSSCWYGICTERRIETLASSLEYHYARNEDPFGIIFGETIENYHILKSAFFEHFTVDALSSSGLSVASKLLLKGFERHSVHSAPPHFRILCLSAHLLYILPMISIFNKLTKTGAVPSWIVDKLRGLQGFASTWIGICRDSNFADNYRKYVGEIVKLYNYLKFVHNKTYEYIGYDSERLVSLGDNDLMIELSTTDSVISGKAVSFSKHFPEMSVIADVIRDNDAYLQSKHLLEGVSWSDSLQFDYINMMSTIEIAKLASQEKFDVKCDFELNAESKHVLYIQVIDKTGDASRNIKIVGSPENTPNRMRDTLRSHIRDKYSIDIYADRPTTKAEISVVEKVETPLVEAAAPLQLAEGGRTHRRLRRRKSSKKIAQRNRYRRTKKQNRL